MLTEFKARSDFKF